MAGFHVRVPGFFALPGFRSFTYHILSRQTRLNRAKKIC
jgi:hypothetical protein